MKPGRIKINSKIFCIRKKCITPFRWINSHFSLPLLFLARFNNRNNWCYFILLHSSSNKAIASSCCWKLQACNIDLNMHTFWPSDDKSLDANLQFLMLFQDIRQMLSTRAKLSRFTSLKRSKRFQSTPHKLPVITPPERQPLLSLPESTDPGLSANLFCYNCSRLKFIFGKIDIQFLLVWRLSALMRSPTLA